MSFRKITESFTINNNKLTMRNTPQSHRTESSIHIGRGKSTTNENEHNNAMNKLRALDTEESSTIDLDAFYFKTLK